MCMLVRVIDDLRHRNVNSAKSFVYQNELPTADMLTRGLVHLLSGDDLSGAAQRDATVFTLCLD